MGNVELGDVKLVTVERLPNVEHRNPTVDEIGRLDGAEATRAGSDAVSGSALDGESCDGTLLSGRASGNRKVDSSAPRFAVDV